MHGPAGATGGPPSQTCPDPHPLLAAAVPCLRRAAAVEEYGEQQEIEVEGGEEGGEGWVTADTSRPPAEPTVTNADGFEEIPTIGGSSGGGGGAGEATGDRDTAAATGGSGAAEEVGGTGEGAGDDDDDDDDVPDIADLEIEDEEEEQDAVGGIRKGKG